MYSSSLHHSFDISLAKRFGIQEAILIHHFSHWIKLNRTRRKNFREGRTYTYMTYQEISDHFGYLTYDQVRRTIEKLCHSNILLKGNFNSLPSDNTIWFSFHDEESYVPFDSKEDKESFFSDIYEISQKDKKKCQGGVWQKCQGSGKNARAIPDTKRKINIEKKEQKKLEATQDDAHLFLPKPKKVLESTPDGCDLFSFFLDLLKSKNPGIKEPKKESWIDEFSKMVRIDNRNPEETKKVLRWAFSKEDPYWISLLQSPKAIRKHFDRAFVAMKYQKKSPAQEEEVKNTKRDWIQRVLSSINFKGNNLSIEKDGILIMKYNEHTLIKFTDTSFENIVENTLRNWGFKIDKELL